MSKKPPTLKSVEALTHDEAKRKNIPTAEHQSVLQKEQEAPRKVKYPRNTDLDPQLVWRGKDEQDWSDLVVHAPPLYIQEKVHPKVIIDDLVASAQWSVASGKWETDHGPQATGHFQPDLFADFNGIPKGVDKTEFYAHDQNWSNRMILGDSLQVMASLAEREGLRGKVQCIYFDPPYGIKFNSNFQWSTTSRDVKDGNAGHITREPEQVKAFRDTWRNGIHSYLTYLRDRLTVARDLLTDSGSIFVQISDENAHRVRALMDEVFGEDRFVSQIAFSKTSGLEASQRLSSTFDYILWYCSSRGQNKYRPLLKAKLNLEKGGFIFVERGDGTRVSTANVAELEPTDRPYAISDLTKPGPGAKYTFHFRGEAYDSGARWWGTQQTSLTRLAKADRLQVSGRILRYIRYLEDAPTSGLNNSWEDTGIAGFASDKVYVVQTSTKVIERCILMTTDPGDLVLDPTCGSGTTATVAEQWGRRWITIDTSRVALALARARIMGARYPFYLLADSREGQIKEAEIRGKWSAASGQEYKPLATGHGSLRMGFVYERVPHITLKSIANNAEIDVIWEQHEQKLAPLRGQLSEISGQWSVASGQRKPLEEWEIPREAPPHWPPATQPLITAFWRERIERQKTIDKSIAAKAEFEYLYDKPYTDNKKVRVAGPFTVESLSPHRMLGVDENDELIDALKEPDAEYAAKQTFPQMILDNLKTAGAQQAHKEGRITFTALNPWPGDLVCAVGTVASDQWSVAREEKSSLLATDHRPLASDKWPVTGDQKQATDHKPPTTDSRTEFRAGIFIGPEFGTVQRADLVAAAREAGDAGFDVLIACAFNYEAHATEFSKLGRIPVLKARMNADLHMAEDLKNTGKGNLFVIFGEPDITVTSGQWLVARNGRLIANYEYVKELSGLGSLEEINRVGRDGLSNIGTVPIGGKIRADQSNQTGSSLSTGQHSGGGGAQRDGGVPSVSGDSQRVTGGNGNLSDTGGTVGHDQQGSGQSSAGTGGRRWSNAQRTQTLATLQNLNTTDFPLSLTTDHKAQVTVHGVDIFKPQTGEVVSDGADGIACWFIDTDYNEESFFVRHAYFLGANDPYSALKTTLKAEINAEAWATLNSDTSRPFEKPKSGRIAVKVINHLGDEVMKVFRV
jgi:adenine-specific DNA-methyltransferase